MKIFPAAAKLDVGADEKHDVNFYWLIIENVY